MRQTVKSLQSKKFKQVVGELGNPRGKSPAPDQIRSPGGSNRSFPCWRGSGYFGGAPGGVLSTAEGPRPFQPGNPPTATAGSLIKLGELDRGFFVRVRWGSGRFVPPSAFLRCMNCVRCATYLWYVARPCIPPHQCGGSKLKCPAVWPRECPRWWHSRGASSSGSPLVALII